MKLWIGGEIEASVADQFRLARNEVENYINSKIKNIKAKEVNDWDVIAILRDDDQFEERIRFNKKDGMDIRLKIPFESFKVSDIKQQKVILLEMLNRSLSYIFKKYPNIEEINQVKEVVSEAIENA